MSLPGRVLETWSLVGDVRLWWDLLDVELRRSLGNSRQKQLMEVSWNPSWFFTEGCFKRVNWPLPNLCPPLPTYDLLYHLLSNVPPP